MTRKNLKSNFSDDQVDDDACRKLVVIRVLRLHVNLGINILYTSWTYLEKKCAPELFGMSDTVSSHRF